MFIKPFEQYLKLLISTFGERSVCVCVCVLGFRDKKILLRNTFEERQKVMLRIVTVIPGDKVLCQEYHIRTTKAL